MIQVTRHRLFIELQRMPREKTQDRLVGLL